MKRDTKFTASPLVALRAPAPWFRRGLTRAAGILLVLIAVMSVVIAVPIVKGCRERSAAYSCSLSVDKMQGLVDTQTLLNGHTMTIPEVQAFLDENLAKGEILCPDGGEFVIIEVPARAQPMTVVCCRHVEDTKQRTRLCAVRALERVRQAVRYQGNLGVEYPEQVDITLNSRTLTALRTEAETGLKRGTSTTSGYKGTVAFYGLAGYGDFPADASDDDTKPGAVRYFSYADENHCANWSVDDGWSGDSYQQG